MSWRIAIWAALLAPVFAAGAGAADGPPAETPEAVASGERLYRQKCVWCHGIRGRGDGPAAPGMGERGNPRPTDFTRGEYKVRSTPSGQAPTDEDLFVTLTRGMPGTSMLPWRGLSEAERWHLVYYIKTFSDRFGREERAPISIGEPPAATFESLRAGRRAYAQMECGKCHGPEGRGDGPSAAGVRDLRGDPLRVTDLTDGGTFKGGNSAIDVYRTLRTGMGGSAMPSFEGTVDDGALWSLANYVHALSAGDPRVLNLRQFRPLSGPSE